MLIKPGVVDGVLGASTGCSACTGCSISGKLVSGTDGSLAKLFITLSSSAALMPFKDSALSTATLTRLVNFAFISESLVFCKIKLHKLL